MTWINDIIQNNANRIFEYPTIQEFCFLRIYDENKLLSKNIDDLQGEEETLAAKGYKRIMAISEDFSIIDKPENKRVAHYKQDKYKLIGISLTSDKNSQAYKHLENFIKQSSTKELFLVQKFFPEFEQDFLSKLKSKKTDELSTKILKYIYQNSFETEIDSFITDLSRDDLETIDLIVLAELQSHFSKQAVTKTIFKKLSAKDLIIGILENFENSVKKITDLSLRYGKDKQNRILIAINDEYDVQDLLYFSLKSVFPEIKYEDDTSNYGGSAKRLDFYLKDEGIIIEVKHIDKADDKKYTKQMKEDLQSYHVVNTLTEIIFFIYAPNSIQDINNFQELEGEQTIQGKTFNVKVIIVR
ncbi:hypothetical protein [Spirosoma sp. 48-14]|uniref:PD-(D/E)XK nuclease domain-containing protein n=2 Tax=unclassified Spirosoma TaxID=2621999 RepID=UPI00096600B8|nr:hypothetical protein [Spirosoma sp. 48-14]OJW74569.1 MAG: hypothetical protein BGO59_20210 [Spirosoma sp. 48-14]